MNDVQKMLADIEQLQKRVSNLIRHGTVADVKPGFVKMKWAEAGVAGASDDFNSPWIRTSQHNGAISESVPYKIGQTVTSMSMDPDHLSGILIPHSHSDNNPLDKDASNDAHTYRWRKPQDDSSGAGGQSSGGSSSNGSSSGTQSKAQDDDEDFTYTRSYDGHTLKVGTKMMIQTSRSAKTVTVTNDKTTTVYNEDKITHKVGDNSTITHTADEITKQIGDVVHKMTASGHELSGGYITHNGLLIDATHQHKDVMPGAGLTGIPIPK